MSAAWQKAVVCDDSAVCYLPRPTHKLVLSETVEGKVITQGIFAASEGENVSEKMQYASLAYREPRDVLAVKDDIIYPLASQVYWVNDLGEETAGYFTLEVDAAEGAVLWIACGEHLADLRVRSLVGGRNFAFRCICREGRQRIRFYVRRLAGRYLQFFAHDGIRAVYHAGLHRVEYPLDYESEWKSGDRLMNRIYEVGRRTLHLCMHEHYEDCPQREQALYAMDSHNQMLCGYYAFGETRMPRASLELLVQSQTDTGMLEMCAPSMFDVTISSFSLAWVLALEDYGRFTGDLDFVKAMQPTAKGILEHFIRLKQDGLIMRPNSERDWNFYEWTEHMDNIENWGQDPNVVSDAPLNALCATALASYETICGWAHMPEERAWAKSHREEIIAAFHGGFYAEEQGAYKNYITKTGEESFSQLTQALALLAGCVPKKKEHDIRKKLLSGELVETSLSYLLFKYEALLMEPEIYGEYVLDDIARQWGRMLYEGATSFWETISGEADFDRAGSLCHGWSAVPIYIFWRYVMGIYPNEPGKMPQKAHPVCGGSLFAKGSMKMPDGIYDVIKDCGGVRVRKQD